MKAYKVYEFVNPRDHRRGGLKKDLKITKSYWTLEPGDLIQPKRNMGLTRSSGKVTATHSGVYINKDSLLLITKDLDIDSKTRKFWYIQIYPSLIKNNKITFDYIKELQAMLKDKSLTQLQKSKNLYSVKHYGSYFRNYPLLMKEKQFNNRFEFVTI